MEVCMSRQDTSKQQKVNVAVMKAGEKLAGMSPEEKKTLDERSRELVNHPGRKLPSEHLHTDSYVGRRRPT